MNHPHRLLLIALTAWVPTATANETVTITLDPNAKPLATFVPADTFGAGIDGHEAGVTRRLLRGANLARMKDVGFGPFSYRLRTELAVESWHWNPAGHFSGADGKSGYWLSDTTPGRPIDISYGYRLPRRGTSGDQANNDGYSRLDDGDAASFWKSNPYLDQHFTHEDNARHPQWVVVDLKEPLPIDAVRIQWGQPHARAWRMEYCTNLHADYVENRICNAWAAFPQGEIADGQGGTETRRLAAEPVKARFVRLLLLQHAADAAPATSDIRDSIGYAIRELGIGTIDEKGVFQDRITHAKDARRQTAMFVSSTDPWHTAKDRDPDTEQPGLDAFYGSGLSDTGAPLIPVPLLYDTPENAGAMIAYLKRQGHPVLQIEMGEEPDGQYATPEDYGALYLQVATVLHQIDPKLQLGGPGFQTAIDGYRSWPINDEKRPWMTRFMDYLRSRGREGDFNFFTFEWYPFDDCCGEASLQLAMHPRILGSVLEGLRADGLPRTLPWMITEYGYSAFGCRAEVDIEGALLNAETVGLALQEGAARVYLYGLEPAEIMDELNCNSWGNNALFLADEQMSIRSTTATYHGARLINQDWVGPPDAPHQLLPVAIAGGTVFGLPRVSAFALRLPDDTWSLLVLNKDPTNAYDLAVDFLAPKGPTPAPGAVALTQFSRGQYQWHPAGEQGGPVVNQGPVARTAPALPVTIPAYSLTVVRLGALAH
ncbi:discoidin domain-containing protein [uncultured Thiodictyon sp.]|uniref:discoidin domain-containing protein n=1 Tax=uncultured Thiodictyon sp. TaxID=1846217 RepID=UPI0025D6804D|nr:discoidin domain-containing protein [uncultured Thiodictyon sp.]